MKKFFGEFKKFITRGNVIDLAVGVIIGGAFTAIVNGLSNYVLKPLINYVICLIMGGEGFSDAITLLQPAWVLDESGEYVITPLARAMSHMRSTAAEPLPELHALNHI